MFGQQYRYVSDFTRYMNEFLQSNPDVAKGQVEGRGLLWDKAPLDLDERRRDEESRVQQKAYPYQAD